MKKKVVALILMLALVSTFFVGCSLFETDANRDYHQVVSNVSYNTDSGTLTAVVYKGEVTTQVNYYAAYFMQQYQWSANDVVEYFYNNVARQKLLLLYAQEYLYLNRDKQDKNGKTLLSDSFTFDGLGAWNNFKNKSKKNQVEAYSMFLTIDEIRYCIETVNKQFDDSWQDLIEEREDEASKNESTSDDDESDEEDKDEIDKDDLLSARDQKDRTEDEDEDNDYEFNESIKTVADVVKYFAEKYELDLDESKLSSAYFFDYADKVIRKENNDKQRIMKKALNELKKNIEEQYMDYDYFLVQQMQTQIKQKYSDHIGTLEEVIKEVENDYKARYDSLVADAIASYNDADNSAYNTAVGDKTFAYAAPSKDYLQVKSILLSFSDKQTSAIKTLGALASSNEEIAKIIRNAYATGVDPKEYEDLSLGVYADLGIKVNVSNPDYDSDEDELVDAYTDASILDTDKKNPYANPAVDYLTVLVAMAKDIQAKVKAAEDWATANNMSEIEKYLVKQHASQEAFNDWINLVNDDPGMASSDVYAVTPDGQSTSYVEEYTVLARALASAGVGATTIKDYKTDKTLKSDTITYDGTTEILKKANGLGYTVYEEDMTSSVGEFEKDLTAKVYTLVTDEGDDSAEISFIVNEFGIHIVMIASLPMDENLSTDKEVGAFREETAQDPEDKEKDKTFYVKNDNYLYEYSVKIEYVKEKDEEDNEVVTEEIEKITVETKTIKEYLDETLNTELSGNVTRLEQLLLFGNDKHINKVDKVYKQIVKELEKSINS